MATASEMVIPAISPGWLRDHGDPVSLVGVRPLFAQFAEFYYSAALVVVSHPTGNLISANSRNEHGFSVGVKIESLVGVNPRWERAPVLENFRDVHGQVIRGITWESAPPISALRVASLVGLDWS